MFENAEISAHELPSVETVHWQRLAAEFLRRQLAAHAIALAITFAGLGVLHAFLAFVFRSENIDVSLGWIWVIAVLLAIPIFIWPHFSIPKQGYAVRERDIIYRHGIFWRTVTTVPFNRIQHVEKSSTPIDRRFKLATLQLFTAGGSAGDLKIHGLPAKIAEKLRSHIVGKIGSTVERD